MKQVVLIAALDTKGDELRFSWDDATFAVKVRAR